jgi:hypothetical protein
MVAVVGASILLGGFGLGLAAASGMWWLTRIPWLLVLLAFTLPIVGVVAPFERPAADRRGTPKAWQPLFAVFAVCAGLGLLARNGIVDADGVDLVPLMMPFVGLVVGGVLDLRRRTA